MTTIKTRQQTFMMKDGLSGGYHLCDANALNASVFSQGDFFCVNRENDWLTLVLLTDEQKARRDIDAEEDFFAKFTEETWTSYVLTGVNAETPTL